MDNFTEAVDNCVQRGCVSGVRIDNKGRLDQGFPNFSDGDPQNKHI